MYNLQALANPDSRDDFGSSTRFPDDSSRRFDRFLNYAPSHRPLILLARYTAFSTATWRARSNPLDRTALPIQVFSYRRVSSVQPDKPPNVLGANAAKYQKAQQFINNAIDEGSLAFWLASWLSSKSVT
jgi:hypothetical protein